jgi:uncharacterized membrane protein YgcG
MSTIEIRDEFEDWLDRAVFPQFQNAGITVTAGAKTLIAYVIQSQAQATEGAPATRQAYAALADRIAKGGGAEQTFFQNALAVYRDLYPSPTAVLNVNRAVRLLTELYVSALGNFPCGPTGPKGGQGGQGGSSGEGGQGGSRGQGGGQSGRTRTAAQPATTEILAPISYRDIADSKE